MRVSLLWVMAILMTGVANAAERPPAQTESASYLAMRFLPAEGWSLRSTGPGGDSKLDGRRLGFDFSRGAESIGVVPIDHCLLGTPTELTIRIRGKAAGHPLRLRLATHFMTFEKVLGTLSAEVEQELVTAAPPGPGWTWSGGENDGKLHGPLRITGLFLDRGGQADRGELELVDIRVKANYPPERACVLLAELRDGPEGKRFIATARSLKANPIEAIVNWTVRDWAGEVVLQTRQDLKIPPVGDPAEATIPVPPGQRPFLEAEARLEAAGQTVPIVQAYDVSPVPARENPGMNPASAFGMGLYLGRYPAGELMDRAARTARDAGARWSREGFGWSRIEPRKGEFDFTYYDRLVATAKANGISIYGLLSGWASYTKPYTPEGIDDYCRFAEAVVSHYRNDIRHWEVWNEPNIFFWQGPKDMYARLLIRAYASIRKANPDALVLGCSTAGIDQNFIRRTLELGAPFDILTIHPYRSKLDDRTFIGDLQKAGELARRPDGSLREVWITEMGWATHVPHNSMGQDFQPNTQRQQAQYIARAYIDALAAGVCPNISWYDFRNDGTDAIYFEHNMGVVTRDFVPKPAYRAFATLTRQLEDARVEKALDLGPGVIAYRFVRKIGGAVVAMWSVEGDKVVELPAGKPVRVVDLMGAETLVQPSAGKVQITLKDKQAVFVDEGAAPMRWVYWEAATETETARGVIIDIRTFSTGDRMRHGSAGRRRLGAEAAGLLGHHP